MNLLAYSVLLILWGCCTAQAPCRKPEGFDKEEPAPGLAEEYKNGDIVPYSCRPGYIKLGRLQYQCNNGQWVKFGSARCKEKPCGHPGDIGFGTFEITKGDEFVFGARVEYSCDAGYQMISRITYRDCTATGWSNSLPYCEQRKCLGIQAPKGGRIVITGTQDIDGEIAVGHVLRFECDNPLARPVPREIYCKVTGEWSSDVVECKEIACEEPHISHGTIKNRKDFKKGNTLDYECDAGYKSEGRAPECTEQGWNPEPACTEIVCYYENVENGEVLPKRDIFKEGETVNLHCNFGFQAAYDQGPPPTCTKNGWVPPPRCKSKACDYPKIEGGKLHSWYYNTHTSRYFPMEKGRRIDFSCNDGFLTASGQQWGSITCTPDGWDPTPKCFRTCLIIYYDNMYIQYEYSRYAAGSTEAYRCHQGFTNPEGHEHGTIECLPSGKFSEAVCSRTCTLTATNMETYKPKRTLFKDHERLQYKCGDGYKTPQNNIVEKAQCTQGRWKNTPRCQEITCSLPRARGYQRSRTSGTFRNGDVENVRCEEGYTLRGAEQIQCYYFGWYPQPPSCEEITCSLPRARGYQRSRTSGTFRNGDVENVRCEEGYTLRGAEQIQCYYFGWYPQPPSCEDNRYSSDDVPPPTKSPDTNLARGQCPQPPKLDNTIEFDPEPAYNHGDTVKYECRTNYKLYGSQTITCEQGRWTSPPQCIARGQCPQPPKLDNTIEFDPEPAYNRGDTVKYECRTNYNLYGSQTITCEQGRWTSPPQCIEIEICAWPPNTWNGAFNVAKDKRIFYNEDTVTYSCAKGYHITGSSEITCIGGAWPSAPTCDENTCDAPVIDHGSVVDLKPPYASAATVHIKCDAGYRLSHQRKATCSKGEWLDIPSCLSTACSSAPEVSNAVVSGQEKRTYASGEKVVYKCKQGFALQRLGYTTCEEGQWAELPECKKEGQQCDTAPFIDNGDVDGTRKPSYKSGTYVDYKCQSYYILEGQRRVHCRNGGWSTLPQCLEPCTASPQEMAANNIQLRWVSDDKLYIRHLEFVEFECKRGNYIKDASATPFRVQCNRGKMTYPKCIKQGSCVTSLTEMEENNLILERENTEVSNGEIIEFTCKPGFYSMSVRAMKVACKNGKLNYPQCGSTPPGCPPPPDVENGSIVGGVKEKYDPESHVEYKCLKDYSLEGVKRRTCTGGSWSGDAPVCRAPCHLSQEIIQQHKLELFQPDLISDPVKHKTSVDFKCKEGYVEETSSEPSGQCNAGTIIYPLCVEYKPCKVTHAKLDENNLQLHDKYGKELTFRNGTIIDFKCQSGYIKPDSLSVKCDEKGIIYPTCISKNPCRLNQEDMDGNNLDIEESHHKDKYKNNDIIQFKCKPGFFETGSLLGKCNRSKIAYPKCLNEQPCLLSQPKMDEANIELLTTLENIQYVENSKTVQFRCKAQFKKHKSSSEMAQVCEFAVIAYPRCVPDQDRVTMQTRRKGKSQPI